MDEVTVESIKGCCILDCDHCDFEDINNGKFRCISCYFFDQVNGMCEMYDDQRPRTACMPSCKFHREQK